MGDRLGTQGAVGILFLPAGGRLANIKAGEYYGIATQWSSETKTTYGYSLLFRAFNIFLGNEGERHIRPLDLRSKN